MNKNERFFEFFLPYWILKSDKKDKFIRHILN